MTTLEKLQAIMQLAELIDRFGQDPHYASTVKVAEEKLNNFLKEL